MSASYPRLDGKTVVVTGATSGIGLAAAHALARLGSRLVIVARDPARGEDAVGRMVAASGNRTIDLVLADLASQASIRTLAATLLARYPQIHVLLNNAGVVNLRRKTTVDGLEATFAVNHLGYFLLTTLLLERLKATGRARIVNVASDAHRFGTPDLADLQNEHGRYRAMRVYGQSKYANILFTYELARRLQGSDVTVNCLHPGAVATRLGQNNGRVATIITRALRPFFRTPEQGAETAVYLAASPDVEGVSGRYFSRCREMRSARGTYDEKTQHRLWEMSERLSGVAT